ncbi:MAG: oxalate/formate MFS antiporter, partial [Cupriavidus sp.]
YTAKGTAAMLVPVASVLSHHGGWGLVFTVAAVMTVAAGLAAKFLLQPMRRRFITGHAMHAQTVGDNGTYLAGFSTGKGE